jgi:tetratricopeptide (TPR) repeat protein
MVPLPDSARGRRTLLAVLAVALGLRLAHWAAVRGAPFVGRLVMDSQEYDRWARGIAAGDWLGSGVFFQAPLYPYLVAAIYRIAGARPDAVYLFQIVLSVAGIYALYRAARLMAGERTGLAAAGLAAVYGPLVFYDVQLLKESPATAVVCFLLWTIAAAREEHTRRSPAQDDGAGGRTKEGGLWLLAGLLMGALTLLRENALLVAPLLLPLAWGRPYGVEGSRLRAAGWRSGAFVLGIALALAPVALRNGRVGGSYLPTTFQGGVNFFIGNNAAADGAYHPIVPGKQIPALERQEPIRLAEEAMGRRLSAGEVSRFWLGRALEWARRNPGSFLRLQARKLAMFFRGYEWPDAVDYYWIASLSPVFRLPLLEYGGALILAAAGVLLALGERRRAPDRDLAPALVFLGAWVLSTIAFFLFSRYRLPAVPALLVLGGLPVAALVVAWQTRRRGAAAGWALVCLAALVLPRLAGYGPRLDLVHYNLARLAEERGEAERAAAEYRAALAADPGNFLAYLNLGNLAARRGDLAAALPLYGKAAALEPRSDDAESNLGGAYLALGRPAEAAAHLDRALTLNPENLSALHNRALLALRLGDLETARAMNRRELAVAPESPAARRLAARLAAPPTRSP